jgi:hypothetical protein
MPEFLAETYAPRGTPDTVAPSADDIALAADQVSQPGAQVRFLGAIAVPEDETCFCLYQAPSADAVREAMTRARLRPERISQAVTLAPPHARPRPAPSTQAPAADHSSRPAKPDPGDPQPNRAHDDPRTSTLFDV